MKKIFLLLLISLGLSAQKKTPLWSKDTSLYITSFTSLQMNYPYIYGYYEMPEEIKEGYNKGKVKNAYLKGAIGTV